LQREFAAAWQGRETSRHSHNAAVERRLLSIDLYQDGFNPVMTLAELQRHLPLDTPASSYLPALQACKELVLFFPDWWGAEPAILKGFFDRLFRQGLSYDRVDTQGMEKGAETRGLLGSCRLTLWICSDSTGEQLAIHRELYEKRFRSLAEYCGMNSVSLNFCSPLRGSSMKQRRVWLTDCRESAGKLTR